MSEEMYAKDLGGYFKAYVPEAAAQENSFIGAAIDDIEPPSYEAVASLLPRPFWDGHDDAIEAWNGAWKIAFGNLRRPAAGSSFVASYIDPAFNGHLFMWDSVFMLLFGLYAERAFPFHKTLDNFYARQHRDGFICREIDEATGFEQFHRHDPSSTGPNILAWYELRYHAMSGDRTRLARVFPAILAYHRWLRRYRTWQDGSYWSSGWGCGMDNQPRFRVSDAGSALDEQDLPFQFYHGRMSWIDATSQALLSARSIFVIATLLGREGECRDLEEEARILQATLNGSMWDEDEAWYADKYPDGALSKLKSIASYWTLLAGAVPVKRMEPFIAHLRDPRRFARQHRVPTLSADAPSYEAAGGYWRGSVWAPTNYIVLAGLEGTGQFALAREIALNHHGIVCGVFRETGTFWENYAPEAATKGSLAAGSFVGWTGLTVISVLLEYVMGIRLNYARGEVRWNIGLAERHGVENLPFGPEGRLSLEAESRRPGGPRPRIRVSTDIPLTLVLVSELGEERITLGTGTHSL
jgi:glycogen debranching enzyme